MPRKPSQTMLTFDHAKRRDLRAAVHTLPAPTQGGHTHYVTFQVMRRTTWQPTDGSRYSRNLADAVRHLARAGFAVPTALMQDDAPATPSETTPCAAP